MKSAFVLSCALAFFLGAQAPSFAVPVDAARLLADAPAETLDAYHLFTDAAGRVPNEGVVPYAVNTPLFSDYAEKFRYVFIPPGEQAKYTAQGVLDFPVGTTLVKVFAYPADFRKPDDKVRLIETRLMIRKADGWTPLAYVWNGGKAELKRAGKRVKVDFIDTSGAAQSINYGVPNANQCKECHSLSNAVTPIGPKARNLNGDFAYSTGVENQLAHWTRIGILTGAPDPAAAPRLPRWDDPAAPLDARAKAYLDVNCGHCHNPKGLASNSGLFLTYEEENPSARGILKRPVAAGRGSGGLLYAIMPGHPEQSILLYRMQSTEPGVMMPQIGRTMTHKEAVKLIGDYIASLPAE
ncbi:MAG TPA: SO2930 family diheme c-type cytochrome [Rhizomicrobium sp.]|nr:SO2930 family diheme c-type cytochrome [Rhizomicrobium sp.]